MNQSDRGAALTPSAGSIETCVHRLPVRVYYEDTDFTGLVYHARYLHFLERGRTDFLRCLGVGHAALLAQADPAVFAVRRMALEFIQPARIDDAVVVFTRFEAVRGARLFIRQELNRGEDVLVTAKVEAVVLTPQGRPRRAPDMLIKAIAPVLPPPEGPR